MNDSLCPLHLRAEGPHAVGVPPALDLSMGSSDPNMVRERSELVACLEATKVILHATEEETSAAQAKLTKADAMVVGEFLIVRKDLCLSCF